MKIQLLNCNEIKMKTSKYNFGVLDSKLKKSKANLNHNASSNSRLNTYGMKLNNRNRQGNLTLKSPTNMLSRRENRRSNPRDSMKSVLGLYKNNYNCTEYKFSNQISIPESSEIKRLSSLNSQSRDELMSSRRPLQSCK